MTKKEWVCVWCWFKIMWVAEVNSGEVLPCMWNFSIWYSIILAAFMRHVYEKLCWVFQFISFLPCESLCKWENLFGEPVLVLYSWQIKLQVVFFSPFLVLPSCWNLGSINCLSINLVLSSHWQNLMILLRFEWLTLFQDKRLEDNNWLVDLIVLSIEISLAAR